MPAQELDSLKALYYGLPDLLTRVVGAEQRRVPPELAPALSGTAWSCCYLPQVPQCTVCVCFFWGGDGAMVVVVVHCCSDGGTEEGRAGPPPPKVGFAMRLEGGRLPPHLEEHLPDWQFAFEAARAGGAYGGDDDCGEPQAGCYYHTATTRWAVGCGRWKLWQGGWQPAVALTDAPPRSSAS